MRGKPWLFPPRCEGNLERVAPGCRDARVARAVLAKI